jgi:predicted RNase H-like HicB family nuclease
MNEVASEDSKVDDAPKIAVHFNVRSRAYIAVFQDLPKFTAFGDTADEARDNLLEVWKLSMERRKA